MHLLGCGILRKIALFIAGKIMRRWGTTTVVGFSADSKVAATVEQDVIVLWEVATGEPMMRLSFPVKIKSLGLIATWRLSFDGII